MGKLARAQAWDEQISTLALLKALYIINWWVPEGEPTQFLWGALLWPPCLEHVNQIWTLGWCELMWIRFTQLILYSTSQMQGKCEPFKVSSVLAVGAQYLCHCLDSRCVYFPCVVWAGTKGQASGVGNRESKGN